MDKFKSVLKSMRDLYLEDHEYAVRSKKMIGMLENFIKKSIEEKLTNEGKKDLQIVQEEIIFQDEKEKNVDILLSHPTSGPLITIGVRSQMSSIAKNTLTYIQDIKGECLGLQKRFPMSVHAYVYMLPKEIIIPDEKKSKEVINHEKYAKIFNSMGGRAKLSSFDYKSLIFHKEAFDYFSYFVVDFKSEECHYKDNWLNENCENLCSIEELINGIIKTSKERLTFKKYFK